MLVPDPALDMKALRGRAVTFGRDPFHYSAADSLIYEEDALVVIADGRIAAFGPYDVVRRTIDETVPMTEYGQGIITAGFIDAHVHYPQLQVVGAYGGQLLEWLERHVFPAELAFADVAHAERVARRFLRELLRAGTTSAAVYCTVHAQSVDAFFAESERFNTRMIAGKLLMDRNAPAALLDTAQRGYDESAALIGRWHGRGRQHYGVTPRFAPTSSEAQLEAAATLLREHDALFMQTHVSENLAELDWVRSLFPDRRDYIDVYAHAGLLGPRAVLGHGVHLGERELQACHQTGTALAHCPTSNLFLGSGLFRLFDALDPRRPVRVGLGTDIGAGTSLSQLATLNEAYKVAQLTGHRLGAAQAFYLATLGGAAALRLDDRIGRIAVGYEADLCVLDPRSTDLLAFRSGFCDGIDDLLFVLMTLGDDRAVRATYAAGHLVYDRERKPDPFRYPPPPAAP